MYSAVEHIAHGGERVVCVEAGWALDKESLDPVPVRGIQPLQTSSREESLPRNRKVAEGHAEISEMSSSQ